MKNSEALKGLCNAMANTFYPDDKTIELALFNEGIDPTADATPKDPEIFRVAVSLIKGYVEGSRSENGVSTSVREEGISNVKAYNRENGIMWICYSAVFWISTIMGIRSVSTAGIVLAVGCLGGLPLLVIAYNRIYRKYKR